MISVLIATRNRCTQLEQCLQNLAQMETPGLDWEIVVVDNGSSDRTEEVVRQFAQSTPVAIRYFWEGRPGKSAALNTGIRNVRGSIVAFTDDDCVVDSRWLSTIDREFRQDPHLKVLGGRVELYDSRDQPISLVRFRDRLHLVPEDPSVLIGRVIGANMAIRREIVEVIGGFDTALGPGVGQKPLGAEDVDFVYRACRAQLTVAYSPDCVVYHNHGRRTQSAMRSVVRTYNRGIGAFYSKFFLARDWPVVKAAYWTLKTQVLKICSTKIDGSERRWRLTSVRDLLAGMWSCPFDRIKMIWTRQKCCGLCPLGVSAPTTGQICPRSRKLSLVLSSVPRRHARA